MTPRETLPKTTRRRVVALAVIGMAGCTGGGGETNPGSDSSANEQSSDNDGNLGSAASDTTTPGAESVDATPTDNGGNTDGSTYTDPVWEETETGLEYKRVDVSGGANFGRPELGPAYFNIEDRGGDVRYFSVDWSAFSDFNGAGMVEGERTEAYGRNDESYLDRGEIVLYDGAGEAFAPGLDGMMVPFWVDSDMVNDPDGPYLTLRTTEKKEGEFTDTVRFQGPIPKEYIQEDTGIFVGVIDTSPFFTEDESFYATIRVPERRQDDFLEGVLSADTYGRAIHLGT